MEEHAGADVVRFSNFRFDRRRGLLARQNGDGDFAPIPIGSRALDILGLLIDRHGDLVSRDEILNTIWPGVVEGANVTVQISALRRALDEGRTGPSPIQTLPGRGYRFVAPVTRYVEEPRSGSGADENRAEDEFAPTPVIPAPMMPIAASRRRRGAALAVAGAFLANARPRCRRVAALAGRENLFGGAGRSRRVNHNPNRAAPVDRRAAFCQSR